MTRWRAVFADPTDQCSDAGVFYFNLPDDEDPLGETFRRAPKGFEFLSVSPAPLKEYDDAFMENDYPKPLWNLERGGERD